MLLVQGQDTPLHSCTKEIVPKSLELMKLLLNARADPGAVNEVSAVRQKCTLPHCTEMNASVHQLKTMNDSLCVWQLGFTPLAKLKQQDCQETTQQLTQQLHVHTADVPKRIEETRDVFKAMVELLQLEQDVTIESDND